MSENQQKNQWEQNLENIKIELNNCQISLHNKKSCQPDNDFCEKFFDCELRKKYVVAVYESMNKGSGGGFEF